MHEYQLDLDDPTDREIAATLDRDCGPWRMGVHVLDAEPFDGNNAQFFKDANGIEMVALTLEAGLRDVHVRGIGEVLKDVEDKAREQGENPDEWRVCPCALSDDGARVVLFLPTG